MTDATKQWFLLGALLAIMAAAIYGWQTIHNRAVDKAMEPPQVEITNNALETAIKENADMRRRIDELEKQVKQGAKQIKVREREKVDAMPPDAIATAVVDELRLFLGSN